MAKRAMLRELGTMAGVLPPDAPGLADPGSVPPQQGPSPMHLFAQTWPVRMVLSALETAKFVGDVRAGRVDPMSDEGIGRAFDLAGLAVTGAIPARLRASDPARMLASRNPPEYDPPSRPQCPFTDDYRKGTPAHNPATGRLLVDIDGDSLTAPIVVGRRTLGGDEEALTPAQINAIAEEILSSRPAAVAPREIRGHAGAFRRSYDVDGNPVYNVFINDTLKPDEFNRTLAHEVGHAIDYFSGKPVRDPTGLWSSVPQHGVKKQLATVYNDLNNPNRFQGEARGKPVTPAHLGYPEHEIPYELWAEGIRAYLTNPNYFKTTAPKAAEVIRKAAKANERVSRLLQFNALGPGLMTLGALGAANGMTANSEHE